MCAGPLQTHNLSVCKNLLEGEEFVHLFKSPVYKKYVSLKKNVQHTPLKVTNA